MPQSITFRRNWRVEHGLPETIDPSAVGDQASSVTDDSFHTWLEKELDKAIEADHPGSRVSKDFLDGDADGDDDGELDDSSVPALVESDDEPDEELMLDAGVDGFTDLPASLESSAGTSLQDYQEHAAANSLLSVKRKYTHVNRQQAAPRIGLDETKTSADNCAKALVTECCKGRHCASAFTMAEVSSVRKSYWSLDCISKQKQREKWAKTVDKGLFSLVNKRVCSAAVVALVGFSTSTWTESKKSATEGELHTEREHGNTGKVRFDSNADVSFMAFMEDLKQNEAGFRV